MASDGSRRYSGEWSPALMASNGSSRDSGEWSYRIKKTFVEVPDAPGSAPESPRALSDPGSCNTPSLRISLEGRPGVVGKPIAAPAASGSVLGSEQVEISLAGESALHTAAGEWPELEDDCCGEDQDVPPPGMAQDPGVPADSAPSSAATANEQVAQLLMCGKAAEHSSLTNAGGDLRSLPSAGSVGHSLLLCSYVCKNLLGGHCKAGALCRFCHLPHCYKRLAHLDRRNRAVFDLMGAKDKIDVMWPVLQQKVQELGLGNRATQVLQDWRRDVEGAFLQSSKERPAIKPAEQRRLSKSLSGMRLAELCAVPKDDGSGRLREYTERLLRQIRVIALAHGK